MMPGAVPSHHSRVIALSPSLFSIDNRHASILHAMHALVGSMVWAGAEMNGQHRFFPASFKNNVESLFFFL